MPYWKEQMMKQGWMSLAEGRCGHRELDSSFDSWEEALDYLIVRGTGGF